MEKATAIRLAAGLPREYWSVCILAACCLLNRTVDARGITSYETWYKQKPVITHLRAIGATAYAHQDESQRGKMDAKAAKGILVGYDEGPLTIYKILVTAGGVERPADPSEIREV